MLAAIEVEFEVISPAHQLKISSQVRLNMCDCMESCECLGNSTTLRIGRALYWVNNEALLSTAREAVLDTQGCSDRSGLERISKRSRLNTLDI